MNKKTLMKIGIISSLLASILLGGFLFILVQTQKKTVEVYELKIPLRAGTQITEDLIQNQMEVREIGAFGLSDNVIKVSDKELILNTFTNRDFVAQENLYKTSLTKNYAATIAELARYGATSVKISNLQAVNTEIKPNDFVGVTIAYKSNGETQEDAGVSDAIPAGDIALLEDDEVFPPMRVLGVYSTDGEDMAVIKDKNRKTAKDATDESSYISLNTGMVTFDATPTQRAALIKANIAGQIYLTVLPEAIQRQYRAEWGLIDENGLPKQPDFSNNNLLIDGVNIPSSLPSTEPIENTQPVNPSKNEEVMINDIDNQDPFIEDPTQTKEAPINP